MRDVFHEKHWCCFCFAPWPFLEYRFTRAEFLVNLDQVYVEELPIPLD